MKKINKNLLILISIISFFSLFFINNFVTSARGWFLPSHEDLITTLIVTFVFTIIFILFEYRFHKTTTIYIVLSLMLLIGYFGFIIIRPVASMFDFTGFIFTLSYMIGKFGGLTIGIIFLVRLMFNKNKAGQINQINKSF